MLNLFGNLLTGIFLPLLKLPFAAAWLSLSALIAAILTCVTLIFTDRKKFREIKERMQKLQEEAKKMQEENPEKANELMKEMVKLTHEQMVMNTKSTLASVLVVMIFLPWMASIAFFDAGFDENGRGILEIKYFVPSPKSLSFEVGERCIAIGGKKIKEGETFRVENLWLRVNEIDHESRKVKFGAVVKTPLPIPFFSYGFGWLMWYFVCSSFFLYLFRRLGGVS